MGRVEIGHNIMHAFATLNPRHPHLDHRINRHSVPTCNPPQVPAHIHPCPPFIFPYNPIVLPKKLHLLLAKVGLEVGGDYGRVPTEIAETVETVGVVG